MNKSILALAGSGKNLYDQHIALNSDQFVSKFYDKFVEKSSTQYAAYLLGGCDFVKMTYASKRCIVDSNDKFGAEDSVKAIKALIDFDGAAVLFNNAKTESDYMSLRVVITKGNTALLFVFNSKFRTEDAGLAMEMKNYIDNTMKNNWRRPAMPRVESVDREKGRAVFMFPNAKVIKVSVGKGDDFSLKEAFACAISDYTFGNRSNFEEVFKQLSVPESKKYVQLQIPGIKE
jgi:hypothetical protein